MLKITMLSLAGGQGKTTTSVLWGKYLENLGRTVLLIDCDPQANLTTCLHHQVNLNDPTLSELLRNRMPIESCIYHAGPPNLFLIPADDALDSCQDYLSGTGAGASVLRARLEMAPQGFDFCIIDSPPQRSQLALTAMGAADVIIVPAEAADKGYGSLVRTIQLLNEADQLGLLRGKLMGVIPFRDRWVGRTQAKTSRKAIASMALEVGDKKMLPSIIESDVYKKALSEGCTLRDLDHSDLEYPFEILTRQMEAF